MLDLLADVEHVGEVVDRLDELAGERQEHGDATFHVDAPQPVADVALDDGPLVASRGDRVEVPGEHDPLGSAELGTGDDVVADTLDLETRCAAQPRLDRPGERRLVVAHRGDLDKLGDECQ